MASENPNTVQIQAYTPDGFRVYVNVALVPANELDALLKENGYLARQEGANVGETIETMTHVSRRMHTSKKDGSITPKLAFYLDNAGMTWKYDFMYFNNQEQIEEFEALSGIKLFDIPEYEGDTWMARDHAKAAQYIVEMPNPIKVAAKDEPYTFGKETGMTKKIQRFIGSPSATPPEAPHPEGKSTGGKLTEGEYKKQLMALTWESYDNITHQKNSLKKAFAENEINLDMPLETAAKIINTRKALD